MHLQLHGFSVFIDVEKLEAGKFEDKLIQSIMDARNFVLVLSAGALDKCMHPSNLDSSLCFFQSSASHDVLCIEVK